MIKHLFLLVFAPLLFASNCLAQSNPTLYYKDSHHTDDSIHADFRRTLMAQQGDIFTYREYYKDGTWMEGHGKNGLASPVKVGEENHYYQSGKLAIKNHYDKGRLLNAVGYYPNGVMMYILQSREQRPGMLVVYDADSSGNVHIKDGNGRRQETA